MSFGFKGSCLGLLLVFIWFECGLVLAGWVGVLGDFEFDFARDVWCSFGTLVFRI